MDGFQDIKPPSPRSLRLAADAASPRPLPTLARTPGGLRLQQMEASPSRASPASRLHQMELPHAMTPPPRYPRSPRSPGATPPPTTLLQLRVETAMRRSPRPTAAGLLQRLDGELYSPGLSSSSPSARRLRLMEKQQERLREAGVADAWAAQQPQRQHAQRADWPMPGTPPARKSRKRRVRPSPIQGRTSCLDAPAHSAMAAWPRSTGGSFWLRKGPVRWWALGLRVGTAGALARWIAFVEGCRYCAVVGTERLRFRVAQRAWRAWMERIERRRSINTLMHRAVLVIRTSAKATALHHWADHVDAQRQRRQQMLQKAVNRMRLFAAAHVFVAWVSYAVRGQQLGGIAVVAAQLLRGNTLESRFDDWVYAVVHIKAVKTEWWPMHADPDGTTVVATRVSEPQRVRSKLLATAALNRWRCPLLSRAVVSWKLWLAALPFRKEEMRTVLERLGRKWMLHAFRGWQYSLEHTAQRRQVAIRALGHLSRSSQGRAFLRWQEFTTWSRQMKAAATRVVAKLKFGLESTGFACWVEFTKWSKWRKAAAARVVGKLKFGAQSTSFTCWLEFTTWSRQMKAAATRVVAKLKFGLESTGFACWVEFTKWSKWRKAAVVRVVAKIHHRLESTAFDAWYQFVTYTKQNRGKLNRSLVHVRNAMVVSAWRAWAEMVARQKRMRAIAGRIVARMQFQQYLSSFLAWSEWWRECKQNRIIVKKVMTRITRGALTSAFYTWQEHATWLASSELKLGKHLDCARVARMTAVWRSWSEMSSEQTRMRSILSRIMARMQNGLVLSAYISWSDFASECKQNRIIVTKVVTRMTRRATMSAFVTWQENASWLATNEQKLSKHLENARVVRISEAWMTWLELMTKSTRMRAILNRINARTTNGAAMSVFLAWSDWWRECKKNRAIAVKVVTRLTKMQVRAVHLGRTLPLIAPVLFLHSSLCVLFVVNHTHSGTHRCVQYSTPSLGPYQ